MHHRKTRAAIAAAALALVPASAQAATKTVYMGEPGANQKLFNQKYSADVDNYFPQQIAIHAGDSVKFVPSGFHTVDFPAKGGRPAGLVQQLGTVSGANDAAGNPFWFNGQADLGFSNAIIQGKFGKKQTYFGTKSVTTGAPLAPNPKPATVRFTKPGTYTYYCDIHPGMKGTVKVVAKSKKVPTAKQDKARIAAQLKADIATAKKLARTTTPVNEVSVGAHGPGDVEYFGFFPNNLTVNAGTTVKFSMPANSVEVHTATIGPGDINDPNSYVGKLAASFQGAHFDPVAIYPSEPAGTLGGLTPTYHGNGFWNAGVLDTTSATPQLSSESVRFDGAGTYQVYCLIHPFMHATITVR